MRKKEFQCKSVFISQRRIFSMEFAVIPSTPRKMKFLAVLCSLVLCLFISKSHGAERAVWISGESGVHPEHPGKCWSQSLNREFSVGEEHSDKTKCELIRCGQNFRFQRRM